MARVTVEDCLENVANRFELVLVSSKRARQIANGSHPALVDEDNDKPTVIALREVAENLTNASILEDIEEEEVVEELLAVEAPSLADREIAAETGNENTTEVDVAAAIKAALAGSLGGAPGAEGGE